MEYMNKMLAYLCGEELTHWVMVDNFSQTVECLCGTEVFNNPHSIEGELVVEQPVTEAHRHNNADNVQELA